jgi:hypothetical protein
MSKIKIKGLTDEEKPFYKEVRKNYEDKNLKKIYLKYRKVPKIRFKDNFMKKITKKDWYYIPLFISFMLNVMKGIFCFN